MKLFILIGSKTTRLTIVSRGKDRVWLQRSERSAEKGTVTVFFPRFLSGISLFGRSVLGQDPVHVRRKKSCLLINRK